jgi:hypothetical protein
MQFSNGGTALYLSLTTLEHGNRMIVRTIHSNARWLLFFIRDSLSRLTRRCRKHTIFFVYFTALAEHTDCRPPASNGRIIDEY